jgi:hypothetical protein
LFVLVNSWHGLRLRFLTGYGRQAASANSVWRVPLRCALQFADPAPPAPPGNPPRAALFPIIFDIVAEAGSCVMLHSPVGPELKP